MLGLAALICAASVGCATRIPVHTASRVEVRAVEQSIGSVSVAQIEREENLQYWEIFVSDPSIRATMDQEYLDWAEDQSDEVVHGALDATFQESSGISALEIVRISPKMLRYLAGQATSLRERNQLSSAAETVEGLQSVVHRKIEKVGERVIRSSDRPNAQIITEPLVGRNALVPIEFNSNDVYVGTEIALLAASDDEIACVVGHELAHLTEGHTSEGAWVNLGRQTLTGLATIAAGAALAYSNEGRPLSPSQLKAAVNMGQLTSFLLADVPLRVAGWSRGQEREADAVGTYYAWKAGYDPGACVAFMLRMARMERAFVQDPGFSWWRTHPVAAERVVRIRKLVPSLRRGQIEFAR